MRLAVSGTAGIGKTTLAGALAELLELECIPESYEPFFDIKGTLKQSPAELMPVFQQVFDQKLEQERQLKRFITDRCPIDLFHLWLTHGQDDDSPQTRQFHGRCLLQARSYDFLILPAWGSIALQQKEDTDNHQRRVMNPWTQLRNHSAIVGLSYLWLPPEKIIQLPMPLSDPEQRVRYVLQQIKTRIELAQAGASGEDSEP